MVKKPRAVQETQVPSLGREDPLEEDMATHSSILAWEIPWTEEAGRYSPWGHKDSDTTESLNTHTHTHTHKQTRTHVYTYISSSCRIVCLLFTDSLAKS